MSHPLGFLKKFRSGAYTDAPRLDFTLEELLAAKPFAQQAEDRFDLLRLRGWYHFLRQEYDLALAAQLETFAFKPTIEGIKNIGIIARQLRDRDHAIDFFLREEKHFSNKFEFYDVLAHNSGAFGDTAAVRKFGTRSLELKHARYGSGIERPMLPPIPPFQNDPNRNVIAFSLFGAEPRYVQPLLVSADLRPHLYPLWTIRIYVDNSVPDDLIKVFRSKGCQVVLHNSDLPGAFWRFMVADDEKIDRFLVRDADSILNIRERVAVDAWLASSRHFHVMRDFYSHTELILAGLWGGVPGALSPMRKLIAEWMKERKAIVYNQTTVDQIFLREKVWRIVKYSALVHDSMFDFGDKLDFPAVGTLPPWKHVGQDDFIFFKKAAGA
jgi:hypothetical protein